MIGVNHYFICHVDKRLYRNSMVCNSCYNHNVRGEDDIVLVPLQVKCLGYILTLSESYADLFTLYPTLIYTLKGYENITYEYIDLTLLSAEEVIKIFV